VAFRPYGQDHGVFTELETAGWFVVASSTSATSAGAAGGSGALRTVLLVLAGVAPVIGAVLVLRLPSPVPVARPTRPAPARSRPGGAKKGAKKSGRRRK
jgi:hypothetical protein